MKEQQLKFNKPNLKIYDSLQLLLAFILDEIPVEDLRKYVSPQFAKLHHKFISEQNPDKRTEIGKQLEKFKISKSQIEIAIIEHLIKWCAKLGYPIICDTGGVLRVYTGTHYEVLNDTIARDFLTQFGEKMGYPDMKHYIKADALLAQLKVKVTDLTRAKGGQSFPVGNFPNGTLYLDLSKKSFTLRRHDPKDGLTYVLPYSYDPKATAPMYESALSLSLPEKTSREVLHELLAYSLIPNRAWRNLEKGLVMLGSGSNGKSTILEIIESLFGLENISHYSLESLTDSNGYALAEAEGKLLNLSADDRLKGDTAKIKVLTSREYIQMRKPYGRAFTSNRIPILIVASNKDFVGEQTHGYFRRWILLKFKMRFGEGTADPDLVSKVKANELSGVMNIILDALIRLLKQGGLTKAEQAIADLEEARQESNSVLSFIKEEGYRADSTKYRIFKELFMSYSNYCKDYRLTPFGKMGFKNQLLDAGFTIKIVTDNKLAVYVTSDNFKDEFQN